MDTPFQFSRYVTGKYFVGRRNDCQALADLLSEGRSVAMWGPPKSGRMSLLQQTLLNMRSAGKKVVPCIVDMTSASDADDFVRRFVKSVKAAGMQNSMSVDIGPDTPLGAADIETAAMLPFGQAEKLDGSLVVVIREFQNIGTGKGEMFMKALERAMATFGEDRRCQFVFMGSRANAMSEIFQRRKFFWGSVEHFRLSPISDAEISDHVLRGFSAGGKVIDRGLLEDVCRMFRNNIWHINHFFFICDSLSKGYISEITVKDALECLTAVHEPKFKAVMDDLTGFQKSMLRAVLDGHMKLSATDVIEKYGLNSSANVKRLRDALMKKEVVMFNDKDEPELEDPLFGHWLKNSYFR